MKRVELKRIAEFLRRGGPADEKTPFAAQGGALPDNGSFSKNSEAGDHEKAAKEFPGDKDEKAVEGPMSISRKLCFVMSLNLWVLYFLVLAWLLPCRHHECGWPFQEVVERNLSTIVLSTNLETMNVKGLPSLAMIGYADGFEQKVVAMATLDGTFEWNNSLPFNPREIQCNFENTFDANGDGFPDCLLAGVSDVYAFNASNGYVFWHQRFPSEEGNILSDFHATAVRDRRSYLIGTYSDKMVILDVKTGNKILEISLPCSSPVRIQIVTNYISSDYTLWSLVCYYGDKVEAWGFGERDVLNGRNLENKARASDFALLFSGSNSGGSIDLGCDVTPLPGGPLLLSWSDRVVMVTPEATAWERHFPYALTVASIQVGHFSSKENQVAAALRNETDTIIVLMETKNGSIVNSVTLENRKVQSVDKVPGDMDLLVIKSRFVGNFTPPRYNFSDPIPWEQTNFALVDFSNGDAKVKDIVTTFKVVGSALNTQTNGETDLLLIKTENGNTSYQKHVIHGSKTQSILCVGTNREPHYSFET